MGAIGLSQSRVPLDTCSRTVGRLLFFVSVDAHGILGRMWAFVWPVHVLFLGMSRGIGRLAASL
jgi:hypothetical protein